MNSEELNFRKKSTHVETRMKEEAPVFPKSSNDIQTKKTLSFENLNLNSEKIRKVISLFSMTLNEYRELRELNLSLREQGIRAEEICNILKIRVLGVLGVEDEI